MGHLLLKSRAIINIFFTLLASILFFTSCSQSTNSPIQSEENPNIEPSDREWMNGFFTDLLLDESAIYTLWGSKPMTIIASYLYSQEEIDAWLNEMSDEDKKTLVYKEGIYNLPENWAKWENISHKYAITKYLIFKKPIPSNPKVEDIFFVNILNTALTIAKYYAIFHHITDVDFDPLEVVFEIQNEKSTFWETVFDSPVLTGLLLGFGEKNSWCFNWRHCQEDAAVEFADKLPVVFSTKHYSSLKNPEKISISSFHIPAFASFSQAGTDEVIKQYEQEKKAIQKIYKGHNFLDLTLEKLMQ